MKKIVFLADYSLDSYLYKEEINKLKLKLMNYEFINLNWDFLKNENFDFNIEQIINNIKDQIPNENIYCFIGIGFGASLLNLISNEYNVEKKIYFNIITSKNYINPYVYYLSTYKPDPINYFGSLKKQLSNCDELFKSIENNNFLRIYNWFIMNYIQLTNFVSKLSLLDTLKYLKKHELNNIENSNIILNKKNEIIFYKKTIKQLSKKQVNIKSLDEYKHWLVIEDYDQFESIILGILND